MPQKFFDQDSDARILRFILCYSLSDVLMQGKLSLMPETKLGFDMKRAPFQSIDNCVFFSGFPHELLEMNGLFEKRVLNPLFVSVSFQTRKNKRKSFFLF